MRIPKRVTIALVAGVLAMAISRSGAPAFGAPIGSMAQSHARMARPVIAPIPDSHVDAHISHDLSGSERALMRRIMLQLPPEQRHYVVYFATDGSVHANYPYLAAGAKVYRPDSSRSNLLVGPAGDRIAGPSGRDAVPNYNCGFIPIFTGTGPYREIYSKCSTPYVFSDVWVPCNDYTYMHYYPNETAYAYTGGFSSTGNAVDAGFQYSSTFQNWALIVRGSHGQLSNLTRFRCDQTLSLAFYPVNSTLLTAYATGYTTSGIF